MWLNLKCSLVCGTWPTVISSPPQLFRLSDSTWVLQLWLVTCLSPELAWIRSSGNVYLPDKWMPEQNHSHPQQRCSGLARDRVFRDLTNTSFHAFKLWNLSYFPLQEGSLMPTCLCHVFCLRPHMCCLHHNSSGSFFPSSLQIRTPEAQRDIKQMAQDSILANGLDSRCVWLHSPVLFLPYYIVSRKRTSRWWGLPSTWPVSQVMWVELQGFPRQVVLFWGMVVEFVLNVAEELQMSPPACCWYLSFFWLKWLFPMKMSKSPWRRGHL